MVAASASSGDIHPWFAFLIGSSAALLFILVWSALTIIKVDDDKDIVACLFYFYILEKIKLNLY